MMLRRIGLALVLILVASSVVVAAPADDGYIEGYAAAVLQREFALAAPSLRVQQGVITIDGADLASVDQAAVLAQLQRIPGVARVEVRPAGAPPPAVTPPPAPQPAPPAAQPPRLPPDQQVGLLPGGVIFKPLIADPRWPHFSAAWQHYFGDPQFKDAAAVSFGESFAIYRTKLGPTWWEIGLQAGVFSIFDLNSASFDLVNADYLVGLPLSFRYEDLSMQLRVLHQSSHLGDEFLLRTRTNRINLSYQKVDLKVSYEFRELLRVYAGGGYLFGQDPSSLDPWSIQYGLELTSPWPARPSRWRPIAAVDVQNQQENDWGSDVSARAGIEIDGVLLTRKLQFLLEYFNGHSPNGQFYKDRVQYFGLGAHFHF
jgi:Protein of unknown function (DUF1207)